MLSHLAEPKVPKMKRCDAPEHGGMGGVTLPAGGGVGEMPGGEGLPLNEKGPPIGGLFNSASCRQ